MRLSTGRRSSVAAARLGGFVLLGLIALTGCAPTVLSLGADAVYTVSELRTTDEVVLDNKIKIALNKLTADDSFGLWKDVGTVVYQGRVLLIGTVENADDKARAGKIGGTPEGVKEVINDIIVTDEGGIGSFVNDVAIEKSIQTKYLFNGDIRSANYRVRSVNGTLYLIGLAKSQEELDEALEIARGTGDVKEIINYMRIRTPPKS